MWIKPRLPEKTVTRSSIFIDTPGGTHHFQCFLFSILLWRLPKISSGFLSINSQLRLKSIVNKCGNHLMGILPISERAFIITTAEPHVVAIASTISRNLNLRLIDMCICSIVLGIPTSVDWASSIFGVNLASTTVLRKPLWYHGNEKLMVQSFHDI